jgi:hypothetical protein
LHAAFTVVAGGCPVLGQSGMQVERVRHDGCTDAPDRERDGRFVPQLRDEAVEEGGVPVRRGDDELAQIAEANDRDERGDHHFERPKSPLVELQDRKGHDSGNAQATEQGDRVPLISVPKVPVFSLGNSSG